MRFKRHDHQRQRGSGEGLCMFEQMLVRAMNTVEIADRQDATAGKRRCVFKSVYLSQGKPRSLTVAGGR
ncbi:MAG: hypothetical protein BroJett003_05190 [Planctomycetota bacterium]|nr:MAG: hypothetical protein BroJett003_05190 [Planctomycetota bacterium]